MKSRRQESRLTSRYAGNNSDISKESESYYSLSSNMLSSMNNSSQEVGLSNNSEDSMQYSFLPKKEMIVDSSEKNVVMRGITNSLELPTEAKMQYKHGDVESREMYNQIFDQGSSGIDKGISNTEEDGFAKQCLDGDVIETHDSFITPEDRSSLQRIKLKALERRTQRSTGLVVFADQEKHVSDDDDDDSEEDEDHSSSDQEEDDDIEDDGDDDDDITRTMSHSIPSIPHLYTNTNRSTGLLRLATYYHSYNQNIKDISACLAAATEIDHGTRLDTAKTVLSQLQELCINPQFHATDPTTCVCRICKVEKHSVSYTCCEACADENDVCAACGKCLSLLAMDNASDIAVAITIALLSTRLLQELASPAVEIQNDESLDKELQLFYKQFPDLAVYKQLLSSDIAQYTQLHLTT